MKQFKAGLERQESESETDKFGTKPKVMRPSDLEEVYRIDWLLINEDACGRRSALNSLC